MQTSERHGTKAWTEERKWTMGGTGRLEKVLTMLKQFLKPDLRLFEKTMWCIHMLHRFIITFLKQVDLLVSCLGRVIKRTVTSAAFVSCTRDSIASRSNGQRSMLTDMRVHTFFGSNFTSEIFL